MTKLKPSSLPPSKLSGIALETSDIVLSTLQDVASLTPLPYLKEAAGLALGIVNIVQGAKSNKEAFTRLATDACGLVYAILCTRRNLSTDAPSDSDTSPIENNLLELTEELLSIQEFAKKEVSRNWMIRMLKYKSDLDTIQEYRESLRQSLDMFGVTIYPRAGQLKSSISIQENIERVAAQQETFLKGLEDRRNGLDAEEAERRRLDKEAAEEEARIKLALEAEREGERARVERERVEREARERDRREIEQRLQQERIELAERQRADAERRAALRENLERQAAHQAENRRSPPSISPSNPFRQSQSLFNFSDLQNANGKFKVTHIGGDHIVSDNSVTNTNSGNTTTSTVSNSNNDSSVRIGLGRTQGRRR